MNIFFLWFLLIKSFRDGKYVWLRDWMMSLRYCVIPQRVRQWGGLFCPYLGALQGLIWWDSPGGRVPRYGSQTSTKRRSELRVTPFIRDLCSAAWRVPAFRHTQCWLSWIKKINAFILGSSPSTGIRNHRRLLMFWKQIPKTDEKPLKPNR